MRICDELRTTTNSAVFKKLYKWKVSPGCFTKWHGYYSDHDPWTCYYAFTPEHCAHELIRRVHRGKYPNWKLVSKNKRQWMKKKLFLYKQWNVGQEAYDNVTHIGWDVPSQRYLKCWR